jgi:methylated-DNA-protein-cysteine methyltransferase-like protein
MPRSEEAEQWANAVYSAIQEIPHGKVTSYGHIALLLGERTSTPDLPRCSLNLLSMWPGRHPGDESPGVA